MTPSVRRLFAGLVAAGLGAVALCAAFLWAYPPRAAVGAAKILENEKARAHSLVVRLAEVHRREAKRDKILAALLAGRLSLWEAAAGYRELHRHSLDGAHYAQMLSENFPGRSQGERYCQYVIENLRVLGWDNPAAARLARRLQTQLDQRIHRDGTVRLPGTCPRWAHGA
jgi:hypothetical protein